ncbi:MAG: nucleoside recognition protein [Lentimicrobiaceae bacterium]|nr:nucleoside recognition protein [Lentimicrobiaceae bacterium]MBR3914269.1 nucleoside recognition protein [Bacteroidales bacterium]
MSRFLNCVKSARPSAFKTIWWLAKIMTLVSFVIMLLQYLGVIEWISYWMTPLFSHFGLPGEAALAYVSGYFVNCYSAIAVMTTLDLGTRAATILSVMVLCSHNMFVETTVQHKTGSSVARIVAIRTLSAFILAWVLNKIMPGSFETSSISDNVQEKLTFVAMLNDWFFRTLKNVIIMTVLVYLLTVLQKILTEYGIIEYISRFLKPVMIFFGLSPRTAFLWLVSNTLGLAYGAGIMIEEAEKGETTKEENDLLNHHIGISHSNLEDLLLFAAVGGAYLWMLLSRWAMSWILVWERRLENYLRR